MCCCFSLFSWTLDIFERIVIWAFSCILGVVIFIGLVFALIIGISYGYNYGVAQVVKNKKESVKVPVVVSGKSLRDEGLKETLNSIFFNNMKPARVLGLKDIITMHITSTDTAKIIPKSSTPKEIVTLDYNDATVTDLKVKLNLALIDEIKAAKVLGLQSYTTAYFSSSYNTTTAHSETVLNSIHKNENNALSYTQRMLQTLYKNKYFETTSYPRSRITVRYLPPHSSRVHGAGLSIPGGVTESLTNLTSGRPRKPPKKQVSRITTMNTISASNQPPRKFQSNQMNPVRMNFITDKYEYYDSDTTRVYQWSKGAPLYDLENEEETGDAVDVKSPPPIRHLNELKNPWISVLITEEPFDVGHRNIVSLLHSKLNDDISTSTAYSPRAYYDRTPKQPDIKFEKEYLRNMEYML